jgi:two-component system, OmpR family, sensor kinase
LSLNSIALSLSAGESLQVQRSDLNSEKAWQLNAEPKTQSLSFAADAMRQLVNALPPQLGHKTWQAEDVVHTPSGSFEVRLSGDGQSVAQSSLPVTRQLLIFVAVMLAALLAAWAIIEIGLIRKITRLSQRAALVTNNTQKELANLDVADLKGRDELGSLASTLADLVLRVKTDAQREQARNEQERDRWHAVGHEIMSPLQSLMVLHPNEGEASHRYIQRMQQAVRILYGTASPSEALSAAELHVASLDLNTFLSTVASNASFAGINEVHYAASSQAMPVLADEFSLEDVLTHVLNNANRYRKPGSAITLRATKEDNCTVLQVVNLGPHIPADTLPHIFEYGVSTDPNSNHRGQGLFVVKTYLAKMGASVSAHNVAGGVCFEIHLKSATDL